MRELTKIINKINSSSNILLITHENPDGDAVGSMMALFLALKNNFAKAVKVVCPSEIPALFTFIPEVNRVSQDFILGDHDLIIILDCGDLRRTGFANRLKELSKYKNRIINIDHHPKNDLHKLANINYIDYQASSTSELIYDLLINLNILIDRKIATCLLCGLYNDTGAFKHSNTSVKVLKIAAELMNRGAQLKLITHYITNGKTATALKLWGIALSRIKFDQDLGLISSVITYQDIQECQADPQDLAGVVNLINSIPGGKATILLSETEPGKIRASLRTENNTVDVSYLAALFGGGGLKKASGFCLDGHIISDNKGGWEIETKN